MKHVRVKKSIKTKTKILPPRIFQLAILSVVAIHFLAPVWFVYDSPVRFIGLLPICLGIYLNIYSDWLIKKHNTTIKPFEEPSALIEKGPFSYSRNPIYLGMVLIVLGCSILSGSVLSFAIPLLFSLILHFKYIKIEERILLKSFGVNYKEYANKVNQWI